MDKEDNGEVRCRPDIRGPTSFIQISNSNPSGMMLSRPYVLMRWVQDIVLYLLGSLEGQAIMTGDLGE